MPLLVPPRGNDCSDFSLVLSVLEFHTKRIIVCTFLQRVSFAYRNAFEVHLCCNTSKNELQRWDGVLVWKKVTRCLSRLSDEADLGRGQHRKWGGNKSLNLGSG